MEQFDSSEEALEVMLVGRLFHARATFNKTKHYEHCLLLTRSMQWQVTYEHARLTRVVGLLLEVYRGAAGDDLVEHLREELCLWRRQLAQQAVQSDHLLTVIPGVEPIDDDADLLRERACCRHLHHLSTSPQCHCRLSRPAVSQSAPRRLHISLSPHTFTDACCHSHNTPPEYNTFKQISRTPDILRRPSNTLLCFVWPPDLYSPRPQSALPIRSTYQRNWHPRYSTNNSLKTFRTLPNFTEVKSMKHGLNLRPQLPLRCSGFK